MEKHRAREKHWFGQYDELEAFLQANDGESPTQVTNTALCNWLRWQREAYKRTPESSHWVWKIEMLSRIGIDLGSVRKFDAWKRNYDALKEYLNNNNGIRPAYTSEPHLYDWQKRQRKLYKKSKDKQAWTTRVQLMAQIGFDITKSGWEDNGNHGVDLNQIQERHLNQLDNHDEQGGSSNSILNDSLIAVGEEGLCLQPNPSCPTRDNNFLAQFGEYKEFMDNHHGAAPSGDTNPTLHRWMKKQRESYLKNVGSPQWIWRKDMFASIGVDIRSVKTDRNWSRRYIELKRFIDLNGTRPIQQTDPNLYSWLVEQRKGYRKSSDKPYWKKRASLLAQLGINVTVSAMEEKNTDQRMQLQQLQNLEAQSSNFNVNFGVMEESAATMHSSSLYSPQKVGSEWASGSFELHDQRGGERAEEPFQFSGEHCTDISLYYDGPVPERETHEIRQRLFFKRRCCSNHWCAFTGNRVPDCIEQQVVAAVLAFEGSTLHEKRQHLSSWIVDKTTFRMRIASDQYLDLCNTALGRVLNLNDHIFMHVLKNSMGEPACPIEAQKERLAKNFFVELESILKSHQDSSTLVAGRSMRTMYEEYCSYVASNDEGPKHGFNYFSLFWKYHYPHILGIHESSSAQAASPIKHTTKPKLGLQRTAFGKTASEFRTVAVTPPSKWNARPNPKRRIVQTIVPSEELLAECDDYSRPAKHQKQLVTVTRTSHPSLRAKRRKARMLRRKPVYAVR